MATLQETLDNANAIMTGEKEIGIAIENKSLIIMGIIIVMAMVIAFGVKKRFL